MRAGLPRVLVHALAIGLVPIALLAGQDGQAGGGPSLPDPEPFFAAVRENLTRSEQAQIKLAYKERRTELHTNPFGRIGTGGTRVYDVIPNADGQGLMRTLIERDGEPVVGAAQERRRIERGRNRPRRGFKDVVATLRFQLDRRDIVDGKPMIVITFAPKPDAKPSTREGKMARIFSGSIWVDERALEVEKVDAAAIDNLSMGFGVIARLNKGSTVQLLRRPVADGIWAPTSIRFAGEGRAMLFRKLNVDYVLEWFDYREAR